MPSGVYTRTKPVWNKGLTKETDKRIADAEIKRHQTVIDKYGVANVLQSKDVLDSIYDDRHSGKLAQKASKTKELRYGDSHYNNMEKNQQTKLDRYGDINYNNIEKYKETSLLKYGTEHPNQSKQQKDKIRNSRIKNHSQEKANQTILAKYGSMNEYYTETAFKRYETMRKNGTLGNKETQPEKELYCKLCQEYQEENVIKQYYDKERYPFKCDFYIISEDKFIELNGFWTHGPHAFDKNNPEDIKFLADLENENSAWSRAVIYTWTDLDVRKLETAKKNNLNYEVIYWYNR